MNTNTQVRYHGHNQEGPNPRDYSSMKERIQNKYKKQSYPIIFIIPGIATVRGSIIPGELTLYSHHYV